MFPTYILLLVMASLIFTTKNKTKKKGKKYRYQDERGTNLCSITLRHYTSYREAGIKLHKYTNLNYIFNFKNKILTGVYKYSYVYSV